jgi:hypothetical protein
MIKVEQKHRVLPDEVFAILDYIAYEGKGDLYDSLSDEDKLDCISMLCDNPTEWAEKINGSMCVNCGFVLEKVRFCEIRDNDYCKSCY